MLPARLRQFFWDVDFDQLTWRNHPEFITSRLLVAGDLWATRWLRSRLGDVALAEFIVATKARGLRPEQITFWSALFKLSKKTEKTLLNQPRLSNTPW